MSETALLLQRPSIARERQFRACQPYIAEHGYRVVGIATTAADALAMVEQGTATVVVTAIAGDDDGLLRRQLEEVGGRLEYCRRVESAGHGTTELACALYRRGTASVGQIAVVLATSVDRVYRVLRDAGLLPRE